MELKQQIEALVENHLKDTEYFLVNTIISGVKSVPKITVWIDGENGVPIDICAQTSRRLGKELEDMDLIPSAYTLEVSSPGIDQPLKLFRQYKQHIGRKVKILLLDGSTKTGVLEAIEENKIVLAEEPKSKKKEEQNLKAEIAVTDIDKTFVLVSFN